MPVGSGGLSVAFAPGLSPAPLGPFPPPALRTGRAVFPHPALQVDHAARARTTILRFVISVMQENAPFPRISRTLHRGLDGLFTPRQLRLFDVPFTCACADAGRSDVLRLLYHCRRPSTFCLPSYPAVPFLNRRYPASTVLLTTPPPYQPSLSFTGYQFALCIGTNRASRVATSSILHTCQCQYPGG